MVTSRLRPRVSTADALRELQSHANVWTILEVSKAVVLAAAHAVRDHQLNFWDAQLWATAQIHGIPVILSEDFNTGASLGTVRFVNPFAAGFDLSRWLK